MSLEQQPRVRGWLLASVDGQTTGLIPANYVKVLGKRRGRKHAELERLAQVQAQPGNPLGTTLQAPQPNLTTGPVPTVAPGLVSGLGPAGSVPVTIPEELLECVYRETPAVYSSLGLGGPRSLDVVPSTSTASSTVLTIPEKIDL
ncbi:hypothetical protein J4Q44_G00001020 [Coregonus suidteri]|uniref:Uncharacterized protein n=1 Tax=Coregonus suidteri TaxID=861788 RepID=A0AAN8ME23_9TELE